MMKTIAVIATKGGAGKTTLTVNLADAAGTARVLDLDPQASACIWDDVRRGGGDRPAMVDAVGVPRLAEGLDRLRRCGAELAVIDTPAAADAATMAAARAADLVLIPCRPSLLDLAAISASLDIAALARVRAVVVLNAAPARGRRAAEAREALGAADCTVLAPSLGERAAFVHSFASGKVVREFEPTGKAAGEVARVWEAVRAVLRTEAA